MPRYFDVREIGPNYKLAICEFLDNLGHCKTSATFIDNGKLISEILIEMLEPFWHDHGRETMPISYNGPII